MADRIALVTDSTASIDPADVAAYDVTVVPLGVVAGDDRFTEGVDVDAERLTALLRSGARVSTSRPSPEVFARTYADLAAGGADAIVSVHLSGEVSGTYESAAIAASRAPVPVHCVDSRQVGLGTGYALLAAARVLADGGRVERAIAAAAVCAERTGTWFYVDTLEHLRRGGRVSALGSLLGTALAVKPLLMVRDGVIVPGEKLRTSARALARLRDLAVAHADELGVVDVAVQHLAAPERAAATADDLAERIGVEVPVREVGAVLGAHVGPGMVAVVVAPRH